MNHSIRNTLLPFIGNLLTRCLLIPFYRYGAKILARIIWRPRIVGFDKIPKKGAALLISNHVSYVDGLLLYAASRRPVRFVIDDNIFRLPGVHYFMTLSRAIPIAPTRDSVTKALGEVSDALRAGELVCIFPEGTLTRSGSLGRFRPGVEWMIKRDPVPVVPMAINGLWGSLFSRKYIKRRFWWWLRRQKKRVTLVCGDPIPPEHVTVNRLQREVLRLKYSVSD